MRTFELTSVILLASGLLLSPCVNSASTEVTWQNPENYRDIRPTNEIRSRFQKRTFAKLEEHIAELAHILPDDYFWSIIVTDVDLAGQVWPTNIMGVGMAPGNDMRIIDRVDFPRMTFSYQLKDEKGVVVKEADVDLKEQSFLEAAPYYQRHEPLAYERNMLRRWFLQEFKEWRNLDVQTHTPD